MGPTGYNSIREIVGDRVLPPMADGVQEQRYVTLQVTGQKHDRILNALHEAGLMKKEVEGPRDLSFSPGKPQLRVVTGTSDFLTFEDVNDDRY